MQIRVKCRAETEIQSRISDSTHPFAQIYLYKPLFVMNTRERCAILQGKSHQSTLSVDNGITFTTAHVIAGNGTESLYRFPHQKTVLPWRLDT